jgi:C_GCAxxG_C_C family probable redox protein
MDVKKIEWLEPPALEPGEKHLNCCQKTLIACRDIIGISEEEAERLGTYFGGGMRYGGVCGPVSAVLMILGKLYGGDDGSVDFGKDFMIEFAKANNNSWLCEDIRDEEHTRCDAAIEYAIEYVKKLTS